MPWQVWRQVLMRTPSLPDGGGRGEGEQEVDKLDWQLSQAGLLSLTGKGSPSGPWHRAIWRVGFGVWVLLWLT